MGTPKARVLSILVVALLLGLLVTVIALTAVPVDKSNVVYAPVGDTIRHDNVSGVERIVDEDYSVVCYKYGVSISCVSYDKKELSK